MRPGARRNWRSIERITHRLERSPTRRRPSIIDTVRSAAPASVRSWVMNTTVLPVCASPVRISNTACPLAWSSAPVGSSATTRGGRVTIARAMPTRCCSPPLIWAGNLRAWPPRPTRSSAARAAERRRRRPAPEPLSSIASSTFSAAVSVGSRWKSWNTMPTFWPRQAASWSSFIRSMRVPSTTSEPGGRSVDAGDQRARVCSCPSRTGR